MLYPLAAFSPGARNRSRVSDFCIRFTSIGPVPKVAEYHSLLTEAEAGARQARAEGCIAVVLKGQALVLVPELCLPGQEQPHRLTDLCHAH